MTKQKTQVFYHFTSEERVESIRKSGIIKGDVPTTPTEGFNTPWLTNDGTWASQGWGRGSTFDKSSVRITVEVPTDDGKLEYWPDLAENEKVSESWYNTLDEAAGGGSENWYVYRGKIPSDWITNIENRPDFSTGMGRSTSEIEAYMRTLKQRNKLR